MLTNKWNTTEFGSVRLDVLEPYYDSLENRYAVCYNVFNTFTNSQLSSDIEYFETIPEALTFFNHYLQTGFYREALNKARKPD